MSLLTNRIATASLLVAFAGCTAVKDDGKLKDLETRLAKTEAALKEHQEYIEFLKPFKAQAEQQKAQEDMSQPDPNARFAIDLGASPRNGTDAALVTIVEGFDFACPYCERVSPVLDELVTEYKGKVRVVFKNFVVHPQVAQGAHLASCAAAKQGKYVEFKDKFWSGAFGKYSATRGQDASGYTDEALVALAGELKLDKKKFAEDMKGPECKALVDADMAELSKFGVQGTPAMFVNGKMLPGAVPKEQLKALIDEELKIAEASGVPADQYYQKEIFEKGEKKFKSRGKAQ